MLATPPPLSRLNLRGRSFLALVLAPQFPMAEWFGDLDREMAEAPRFFAHRPVVVDLAAIASAGPEAPMIVLEGLEARGLRLVGVEGVSASSLAGTRWAGLAETLPGRDQPVSPTPGRRSGRSAPARRPAATSLLIDRPVRSGQSVVFEEGDVIVLGAVASGAEVLAGGSIHVYGPLRGRAIAGLVAGPSARIFCRRLEAEMVGVDRLYRTAEHWGPALHGRAVQVLCDRGALRLLPLD
ncbi:septum site-determining protein MinC [Phenylobacterium soli]|uniref:Probable septum site-determining protein MinC n=2 Tax=Phenylobacterium soli TaxID=2170551 RepID=A0A328AMM5_9CAUL|nr:septum site-determining protein MinC [Phenylobacterium soli]